MDAGQPPLWYTHEPASSLTAGNIKGPTYFVLSGANGELVRISMQDGSITYGPTYSPDAAAKVFWKAVSEEYRKMLRWKAEHPKIR